MLKKPNKTNYYTRLRHLLSQNQGHDSLKTPVTEKAVFVLRYKKLEIGRLSIEDGWWTFVYADDFKNQSKIAALIDFPNIDKTYVSETLWPFLSIRIPSLRRPSVQRIIKKENIDERNTVELLKRFGKKTISNPFYLAVAS